MAIHAAMEDSKGDKKHDGNGLKCPISGRALASSSKSSNESEGDESTDEEHSHPKGKERAISPSGSFNGSLMSHSHGSVASGIRASLPATASRCPVTLYDLPFIAV
jgi:hypothetical protein